MLQSGSWYTYLRDWWEGLLSGWGLQGKCMSVLSLRWLGVGCENTQKSNLGVAKIWIERLEEVWNPNSLVPTGTWAVSPHPFWLDFSNWGDVWVCWPPSNAELPCCTEIQPSIARDGSAPWCPVRRWLPGAAALTFSSSVMARMEDWLVSCLMGAMVTSRKKWMVWLTVAQQMLWVFLAMVLHGFSLICDLSIAF